MAKTKTPVNEKQSIFDDKEKVKELQEAREGTFQEQVDNDIAAITQVTPEAIEKVEPLDVKIAEQLITSGNLQGLNAEQRIAYYKYVCDRSGLDYTAQPFEYIIFNKRVVLYAKKGCAEQLRRKHGISVIDTRVEQMNGMFVCTCTVQNDTGRTETDVGAVLVSSAPDIDIMKAVTKAKRRATLGICGLGSIEEAHPKEYAHSIKEAMPKSRVLLQPEEEPEDEATAKKSFRDVCLYKTGRENLPVEILQQLLAQAHHITGEESILKCAAWVRDNAAIEWTEDGETITATLKEQNGNGDRAK